MATNTGRRTFSPWATNTGKNNRRISTFHSTGGAFCLSLSRGTFTLGVQAFEAWLYTFMSHNGWSKKRRHDGTPGGRYATGHCPVVVYVRRTHDGTLARGIVQATGQTMRHVLLPVFMWFVITF